MVTGCLRILYRRAKVDDPAYPVPKKKKTRLPEMVPLRGWRCPRSDNIPFVLPISSVASYVRGDRSKACQNRGDVEGHKL